MWTGTWLASVLEFSFNLVSFLSFSFLSSVFILWQTCVWNFVVIHSVKILPWLMTNQHKMCWHLAGMRCSNKLIQFVSFNSFLGWFQKNSSNEWSETLLLAYYSFFFAYRVMSFVFISIFLTSYNTLYTGYRPCTDCINFLMKVKTIFPLSSRFSTLATKVSISW